MIAFQAFGARFGRGVGCQIRAKAVTSSKVFCMTAFPSFWGTFLGGASGARTWGREGALGVRGEITGAGHGIELVTLLPPPLALMPPFALQGNHPCCPGARE